MGETVSHRSNGGTGEGYLATPLGGAGPAVIVIQDLYRGGQTIEPGEAGKRVTGLAILPAAPDIAGAAARPARVRAVGQFRTRPAA